MNTCRCSNRDNLTGEWKRKTSEEVIERLQNKYMSQDTYGTRHLGTERVVRLDESLAIGKNYEGLPVGKRSRVSRR